MYKRSASRGGRHRRCALSACVWQRGRTGPLLTPAPPLCTAVPHCVEAAAIRLSTVNHNPVYFGVDDQGLIARSQFKKQGVLEVIIGIDYEANRQCLLHSNTICCESCDVAIPPDQPLPVPSRCHIERNLSE